MWTIRSRTRTRKIRSFVIGILMLFGISTLIEVIFDGTGDLRSIAGYFREVSYGVLLGGLFWFGNYAIGYITGTRLNWNKPVRANMISLLSFIGYGIVVSLAMPYIFHKYVWHVPEERLLGAVIGNAFLCISIDIIIISVYYSNYIVYYWGETIKKAEELKRESLIAKYEALKNQVNPHFLFNTLNTLSGVVEKTPEKAPDFIRKFADIYRYVLEQKDKELIPLQEELKFLDDFVYLLKIRYNEGLLVDNQLKDAEGAIVPLGLQILIENAIKHNVLSDEHPLRVELKQEAGYFIIRNNLQKKSTGKNTNKVGLENLAKRYEYLTELPVIINDSPEVFEVKLPVLKQHTS